jgi:serine/threonine protein kinase
MSLRGVDFFGDLLSKTNASSGNAGHDRKTDSKPFFATSGIRSIASNPDMRRGYPSSIVAPVPDSADTSFHGKTLRCAKSVFQAVNTTTFQGRYLHASGDTRPFERTELALMSAILAAKFVLSISSCVPRDVSGLVDCNFNLKPSLTAGFELLAFEQFDFEYVCGAMQSDKATEYAWGDVDGGSKEETVSLIRETIMSVQETLDNAPSLSGCTIGDVSCGQEKSRVRKQPSNDRFYWNIGRGAFAQVDIIRLSLFGQFRARKAIGLGVTEALSMSVIREISLMTGLKHANVVSLTEVGVLFPNAARGDPKGAFACIYTVRFKRGGLVDTFVLPVVAQLLMGLAYLHGEGLVHRDLKPQNVLCSNDGNIKIADLGSARYINSKTPGFMDTEVCTVYYRAPELVFPLTTGYGTPVDMWSAGCTIYELATNQVLFPVTSEQPEEFTRLIEARLVISSAYGASHTLPLAGAEIQPLVVDFELLSRGLTDDGRRNVLDLLEALMKYDGGGRASAQDCIENGPWLNYTEIDRTLWDPDGTDPNFVIKRVLGEKYSSQCLNKKHRQMRLGSASAVRP